MTRPVAARSAAEVICRGGAGKATSGSRREPMMDLAVTPSAVDGEEALLRWSPTLRVLDAVHAALRHPLVLACDGAVAFGALMVSGLAAGIAATGAVGLLAFGYIFGVHQPRDSIQTQGALWLPGRLLPPVATLLVTALLLQISGPLRLLGGAILTVVALTAVRFATWAILLAARRRGRGMRPTMLVGGEHETSLLAQKLADFPEVGLQVVVTLPAAALNAPQLLAQEIADRRVEHVVLLPTELGQARLPTQFRQGPHSPAAFSLVPPLADLFLANRSVQEVGGVPLMSMGRPLSVRTTFPGKRGLDLLLATLMLVTVAPALLLAAVAVKLQDGGPAFFRQQRIGREGRAFAMLKLRTMYVNADAYKQALRDRNVTNGLLFKVAADPRVTPVGRMLRRLSVDELPQLWNVIRGDMSLVGPRPLPARPEDFGAHDGSRHVVRPGITGYWQISGGNGLTYDEMIKLDLAYVHTWSIGLDLRLLARTPPALLHRHGPA